MNVNAKIGQEKAEHPERFCPERGCLWRTAKLNHATQQYIGGGRCPRHGGETCTECHKTKYQPGRVNPTGRRGGWAHCQNQFHVVAA
jgi:hypothetical protein